VSVTIHTVDVLGWARDYSGPPFHALLCDPPYELGFMGKKWDAQGVSFQPETWAALSEHLLPGAMVLAFGGTRTWHRLACALEDAGLEIRDTLMWVYGSGFPKSLDISKAIDKAAGAEREVIGHRPIGYPDSDCWGVPCSGGKANNDVSYSGGLGAVEPGGTTAITAPATVAARAWSGYGTALKPAWEPIIVAMKPLDGTFAGTALKHGVAGINVDGCRVGLSDVVENNGRWPANLIHDGSAEVLALFPQSVGRAHATPVHGGAFGKHACFGRADGATTARYIEPGSAARFFYCAKASRSEREAGLDGLPMRVLARSNMAQAKDGRGEEISRAETSNGLNTTSRTRNHHPTVKPLAITRYLATLILPPECSAPRRLLVPFAGSGSEMIGAIQAGWEEVVGIEREAEYVEIAKARLAQRGAE